MWGPPVFVMRFLPPESSPELSWVLSSLFVASVEMAGGSVSHKSHIFSTSMKLSSHTFGLLFRTDLANSEPSHLASSAKWIGWELLSHQMLFPFCLAVLSSFTSFMLSFIICSKKKQGYYFACRFSQLIYHFPLSSSAFHIIVRHSSTKSLSLYIKDCLSSSF